MAIVFFDSIRSVFKPSVRSQCLMGGNSNGATTSTRPFKPTPPPHPPITSHSTSPEPPSTSAKLKHVYKDGTHFPYPTLNSTNSQPHVTKLHHQIQIPPLNFPPI
ncbi:hypothetical protein RND71_004250 [Anisodus tanguticus]|uniref:Uncharacterized protein n=1 Tax=Anisodus tanguticus TaxID=243964 RepID=A0AAE1SW58_9SOLA|nr:hypothetical protein RND71_004250 [Anisodus tanguticus]